MAIKETIKNFIREVFGREKGRQESSKIDDMMDKLPSHLSFLVGGGISDIARYLQMEDDIKCLTGDTRIAVLNDGLQWVPIKQLAEVYGADDSLFVLSYDREHKKVVCAKAYHPRKTKENAKVFYVVMAGSLKNANQSYVIRATANHPFLMQDGKTYKRVDELKPGDLVMPVSSSSNGCMDAQHWIKSICVVAVLPAGEADVYDLTVPGYENFAAEGVFVHNSRYMDYEDMDDLPELSAALDIYSDDSTQPHVVSGESLWVEGQNQELVDDLNEMLQKRIGIEDELWGIARNLNKYGNDFEELLVKDKEGVVGLNFMATPLVRCIVDKTWTVLGYKYHPEGRFSKTSEEDFRAYLEKRKVPPLGEVIFEDWEVAHFKLGSRRRWDIYGTCLDGDSLVWGQEQVSPIKNMGAGYRAVSYDGGRLIDGDVVAQKSNGIKKVYRMTLCHREIVATSNHPFLVYARIGASKRHTGKEIRHYIYADKPEWKELKDIKVGDRVVISTEMEHGIADVAFGCDSKKYRKTIKIPTHSSVAFCRWFGFMLGGGWVHGNQVVFAEGTSRANNKQYKQLFKSLFGLGCTYRKNVNGDYGQFVVSSKELAEFMEGIGWKNGAHNKRLPDWVWRLPRSQKEALLWGFMDADGWDAMTNGHKVYGIELCNESLLRDIKALIDGLGYACGNVKSRQRRGHRMKDGRIIQGGTSYYLFFYDNKLKTPFDVSLVQSIEYVGEREVFDIQIDNDAHNFVANGIVVHNSVLEAARWIWRRLVLLEDSMLIYRLTRSPSRFVFFVDIGDKSGPEAWKHLNNVRNEFKKKKFVNASGHLDMRYNPLANDEDLFIPVRGGKRGIEVETLQGPIYGAIDDVEYFKDKLYAAIKIPKCLSGETEIPLTNGQVVKMVELHQRIEAGEKLWVYSISPEGHVVPGEILKTELTDPDAKVVEVELDNGEKVVCTDNHPFMLKDGKYREAKDLVAGDSLMSWVVRSPRCGVVAVRALSDRIPVYDLHVKDYHNFAIAQGVYVHNSYLGFEEDVSAKALLSQEDIRFSRTILRIQREIRNGFRRVCNVHLAAKGIDPAEVDFDVMMTIPSAIFEQAYLQVLQTRAEVADKMQDFVSMDWLLREIFHFSDAEIAEMERQRANVDAEGRPTLDLSDVPSDAEIPVEVPEGSDVVQQVVKALKRQGVSAKKVLNDRITLGLAKDKIDKALSSVYKRSDGRRMEGKLDVLLRSDKRLEERLKNLSSLLTELKHGMAIRQHRTTNEE